VYCHKVKVAAISGVATGGGKGHDAPLKDVLGMEKRKTSVTLEM